MQLATCTYCGAHLLNIYYFVLLCASLFIP